MKFIMVGITLLLLFSGCQESSKKSSAYIMGDKNVNPNSFIYSAKNNGEERANKIELSKIDADTKIEIAKIESENQFLIAKLNAQTNKEVAQTDANTKIQTTQIDASVKQENSKLSFYIAIAIIILIIITLILLYLNTKNNRELKARMHAEKLRQEFELKEREHQEQRLLKMLDLVAQGKLSPKMEKEVILSLSYQKQKTIESKN